MLLSFVGGPLSGQQREIPDADVPAPDVPTEDGSGPASPQALAMVFPWGLDPGNLGHFSRFGSIVAVTSDPPRSHPPRTCSYASTATPGVWAYVHPSLGVVAS